METLHEKTGLKILWLAGLFPHKQAPHYGYFNLTRIRALTQTRNVVVKVVSPIGMTPPEALGKEMSCRKILQWLILKRQILSEETLTGVCVQRPKWFFLPKRWFWRYEGQLLYWQIRGTVDRLIQTWRPDFIQASRVFPEGVAAGLFSRRYHIPAVVIAEGSDILVYLAKERNRQVVMRQVSENTAAIVYVSKGLRHRANELGLCHPNEVVIYNGVDMDQFQLSKPRAERDRRTILVVANLCDVKGHDILFHALPEVRDSIRCPIDVYLVGDGPLRTSLEHQSLAIGLGSMVHFVGPVHPAAIKDYYDACDVLCLPSRSESMGIVIVEAMACGKPVVASAVGGIPEIVADGVNGFLVPPESPHALAQALIKALEHTWNSAQIRDSVVRKFSLQNMVRQYWTLYEKVLGNTCDAVSVGKP